MAIDRLGNQRKGMFRQQVVMIEQCNPLTGCKFERTIRCSGNMAILLAENHLDPLILARIALEDRPDCRIW